MNTLEETLIQLTCAHRDRVVDSNGVVVKASITCMYFSSNLSSDKFLTPTTTVIANQTSVPTHISPSHAYRLYQESTTLELTHVTGKAPTNKRAYFPSLSLLQVLQVGSNPSRFLAQRTLTE